MTAGIAYARLTAAVAVSELNRADVITIDVADDRADDRADYNADNRASDTAHDSTDHRADHRADDPPVADAVFARYPGCLLVVYSGRAGCRIVSRRGGAVVLPLPQDLHLAAAESVHDRLVAGSRITDLDAAALEKDVRNHRLSPPLRRGRRAAA
ncbi:hypothetical protein CLV63_104318 [Murinocardiopsis flavida]|uniref:Uncharacterized protein n=1 Tax=Murinocardiopsis flavida TaxID=645275 RepID=A0A2P8DPF2_9ACTN|nr:hypothetical protein [Murinocardiopsis flavida]PSK99094.1 hypothetical protein CLV63_104318 [Murinocardiopsis flavida]